jgi:hypothetical protein
VNRANSRFGRGFASDQVHGSNPYRGRARREQADPVEFNVNHHTRVLGAVIPMRLDFDFAGNQRIPGSPVPLLVDRSLWGIRRNEKINPKQSELLQNALPSVVSCEGFHCAHHPWQLSTPLDGFCRVEAMFQIDAGQLISGGDRDLFLRTQILAGTWRDSIKTLEILRHNQTDPLPARN